MPGDDRAVENLPQLLLRAFYWLDEGLQRGVRRGGGPEISHSQSIVILTIGDGVNRPSAIAERLGISRQAVHQSLRVLVDAGIIDLVPDPDDRRAKLAVLSRDGRPVHRLAGQVLEGLERELAARIGAGAVEQLRRVLARDWGEPPGQPAPTRAHERKATTKTRRKSAR